MRTVNDLLNTPEGVDFLVSKGISLNQADFIARLEIPVNPALAKSLGLETAKPVYALQQVYVDCTQSMLNRMAVLVELEQVEDVCPFFLWIDTDRAGSDKITTRLYWPLFGRVQSIPICPGRVKDIESRFVTLDQNQLQQAIDKLGMFLEQTVTGSKKRATARARYKRLKNLFLKNHADRLGEFNHRITYFLLDNHVNLNPRSVIVSDIVDRGLITAEVNLVINHLEEVIAVFNETVASLMQQGIDPVMKPLAEDYLPLNYSCDICHRRLRLRLENAYTVRPADKERPKGNDRFAVANCRCGGKYRFYLGNRTLSIDELAQTGRWSPDVSLVLFLNDLVSGYVAGKSSGVYYGLVMNEVLERVLNKRRVPVLLPTSLGMRASDQFDSLIYHYLTG